jgi:hypothetical protein
VFDVVGEGHVLGTAVHDCRAKSHFDAPIQRSDEVFLVLEVVIDDPGADARLFGDERHRRIMESALCNQIERRFQNEDFFVGLGAAAHSNLVE